VTSALSRPRRTERTVRQFVNHWRAELDRRASVTELLPHLANGLLLELPGHTVRGTVEFQGWYSDPTARGLRVEGGPRRGEVRVRLASPVHAEVTITAARRVPGPHHQSWWVVLQDGVPRIRSISVRQPASADAVGDS